MDTHNVILSKTAKNDLKKVPRYIGAKLIAWVESVEHDGLRETRKIPSYHDEPLKGKRSGQRSIRLSKSYRAIYEMNNDNKILFVEIIEVNKHEY